MLRPLVLLEDLIGRSALVALAAMAAAFVLLAKCADLFVDSAVALANRFRIPKLVIGIVLVSLATTAPELTVSLLSAVKGRPEMALGNAVGSVICNCGLGLALAGAFSAAAIPVIPHVLGTAGLFLVGVSVLCFGLVAPDMTLGRVEGTVLVALFGGYIVFLIRQYRRGRYRAEIDDMVAVVEPERGTTAKLAATFVLGLAGIVLCSEIIVTAAVAIAEAVGIPESVIALTLVALGTSIPEMATCVTAARKRHGEIAVGNILGANIMNICWVAGASAMAHDLRVGARAALFMFPAMFIMLAAMMGMLWRGHRLTRRKGLVLLGLYVLYLAGLVVVFPPR